MFMLKYMCLMQRKQEHACWRGVSPGPLPYLHFLTLYQQLAFHKKGSNTFVTK